MMRGLVRRAAGIVAVVTAVVGVSAGAASASVVAHRPPRPAAHRAGGSGLSLAQAPAGLRAAVRRTLGLPAAAAGSAFQQAALADPGGVTGDHFGVSVAISGSTAVIGAPGTHSGAGAAYVYTRSGTTWSQQATLAGPGGTAGDYFGYSVAIAGSTVVVGAKGTHSGAGAAYVYVQSATKWSRQATLADPGNTADDYFGGAVAIAGSTVVVGAKGVHSGAGAAYVYTRSATTWSRQATLADPGNTAKDYFGGAVAIAGSTVVIGAYGTSSNTGAAYVFTGSGASWSRQATLADPGGTADDYFGNSVAIAGSTVVIGAYGTGSNTGAAYVFTRSGTTWSRQAMLTAADGATDGSFGESVAIAGSIVVVGAGGTGSAGAGYVFTRARTTWSQETELADPASAGYDYFGFSAAIAGSTLVVGAPALLRAAGGAAYVFVLPSQQATLADPAAGQLGYSVVIAGPTAVVGAPDINSGTGSVYVYVLSGTKWSRQVTLGDPGGKANDNFGWSVAISGSTLVVGAPATNSGPGAAYVYVRSGTKWSRQATLADPAGAAGDSFGDAVAITKSTVVVGAPGSNSLAGAAYVFTRSATTGAWSKKAELTGGGALADFGWSVAISGSTVAVGAPDSSQTGAVYMFVGSGTTWSQLPTLADPADGRGDLFGNSVAIAGSTLVVGAPLTNNPPTGAAYVYVHSGTTWSQQATLTDPAAADDYFGYSVAIAKSTVVIGAPYSTSGEGYLFTRAGTTWSQQATLADPGNTANDYFGDSVAMSGSTAVIGAYGTHLGAGAAYIFANA